MKPRLLLESHVPYFPEGLKEYFDIERMLPGDITADSVKGFNALIARTRTKCDAALLDGSDIEFAGTATIGIDHFDLPYLASRGIEAVNAPGCNAPAVAQYVMASLLKVHGSLNGLTLGVVGVGNVGRIVVDWAKQLGMKVLQCDPPRAAAEGDGEFVGLDSIAAESDIVTIHTPHTKSGPCATHHIVGAEFLAAAKRGVTIVNAARGPIVDTPALIEALRSGQVAHAVIDTWENEPRISTELLALVDIATPHIAGYSLNGKIRAASMVASALCRHFGVDFDCSAGVPAGAATKVDEQSILSSYNPLEDDRILRADPSEFEALRDNYPLRAEVV